MNGEHTYVRSAEYAASECRVYKQRFYSRGEPLITSRGIRWAQSLSPTILV